MKKTGKNIYIVLLISIIFANTAIAIPTDSVSPVSAIYIWITFVVTQKRTGSNYIHLNGVKLKVPFVVAKVEHQEESPTRIFNLQWIII